MKRNLSEKDDAFGFASTSPRGSTPGNRENKGVPLLHGVSPASTEDLQTIYAIRTNDLRVQAVAGALNGQAVQILGFKPCSSIEQMSAVDLAVKRSSELRAMIESTGALDSVVMEFHPDFEAIKEKLGAVIRDLPEGEMDRHLKPLHEA